MIKTLFLSILLAAQCGNKSDSQPGSSDSPDLPQVSKQQAKDKLILGADQLEILLPKLKDLRVALIVNNTSTVGKAHLADTLLNSDIKLVKIFAPEHGFRGVADAGELVKDGVDSKTGLPLISLYGNNKKPSAAQLADVDVIVFDIQDVGTRFFTYISTMHYAMEACAENNKKFIVLDRPNPNGYVDGPVLKPAFKSFVGMHPIPIAHGLTVGELALMINGEGWLAEKKKCELDVIPLKNWTHNDFYSCPAKPSPNLPDDQSIKLYPSTCLFEGTVLSVGRGTYTPFQVIGHPDLKNMNFSFTPISIDGMAKKPPFENVLCYGLDLRKASTERKIDLKYLIELYNAFEPKDKFFIKFFDTLAGTDVLKEQIKQGLSEEQIRANWQKDLEQYKVLRKKYLLYP